MVGDEAAAQRAGLEVTYPVDNGVIRNWDDMELLWNYTFSYVTHAKRQWYPRVGVVLRCPRVPGVRRLQLSQWDLAFFDLPRNLSRARCTPACLSCRLTCCTPSCL